MTTESSHPWKHIRHCNQTRMQTSKHHRQDLSYSPHKVVWQMTSISTINSTIIVQPYPIVSKAQPRSKMKRPARKMKSQKREARRGRPWPRKKFSRKRKKSAKRPGNAGNEKKIDTLITSLGRLTSVCPSLGNLRIRWRHGLGLILEIDKSRIELSQVIISKLLYPIELEIILKL